VDAFDRLQLAVVSIVFTLASFLANLLIVYTRFLLNSPINKCSLLAAGRVVARRTEFLRFLRSTGLETMAGSPADQRGYAFSADRRRCAPLVSGRNLFISWQRSIASTTACFSYAGSIALLWMNAPPCVKLCAVAGQTLWTLGLDRLLAYALALVPLWSTWLEAGLLRLAAAQHLLRQVGTHSLRLSGLPLSRRFLPGPAICGLALLLMLVWFRTPHRRRPRAHDESLHPSLPWSMHAYLLWVGGRLPLRTLYGSFSCPWRCWRRKNLTFTRHQEQMDNALTAALCWRPPPAAVQLITPERAIGA
jgi:hypothetical protein